MTQETSIKKIWFCGALLLVFLAWIPLAGAQSYTSKDPYPPYPIGWKAKIGVLLPSVDTGWGSYDFRRLSPDGVVTLETRVPMGKLTMENLRNMAKDAVSAAKLLASAEPDVITYEATAAGFVLGVEGDAALLKEIEKTSEIPATSGATAVAESLRSLGAKKISVYAATAEDVTSLTVRYLTDKGFTVVSHKSVSFAQASDGFRMSPQELYSEVRKFHKSNPNVDAIFIAGGCFRTLEIIPTMEKDFGVSVVTTVPANMWHCLKIAGYKDPIPGYGRLLERPR
jgi:maleate cis-trans isomerase